MFSPSQPVYQLQMHSNTWIHLHDQRPAAHMSEPKGFLSSVHGVTYICFTKINHATRNLQFPLLNTLAILQDIDAWLATMLSDLIFGP